MKKYLVRAPFDPLLMCYEKPEKWIWKSYAGENSGNLVYAYGVMNVLKTEETELDYFYESKRLIHQADRVNQSYDAVILPMADAFRKNFRDTLDQYTEFVKKLKIPVIVIGIGLRADYEPDLNASFVFDDSAKRFVSAVIDKSSTLGLRGQITADYLKKLGFLEDRHYSVIGCPSLYTYGNGINMRPIPAEIKSIALNTNDYYNIGHINEMLKNTAAAFDNVYLVQQMQAEFVDLYVGNRFPFNVRLNNTKKSLLGERYESLKKEDRVRFFFDTVSWVNFLKRFDLFVGDRFHGSVCAILAGTPSIMLPFNARTREMTEYHRLTCLHPGEVREGTSIIDYLDQLDFSSYEKRKNETLNHYIEFLNQNGLEENIFRKKLTYCQGESPLEKQIEETIGKKLEELCEQTRCYDSLGRLDRARRVAGCFARAPRVALSELRRRMG